MLHVFWRILEAASERVRRYIEQQPERADHLKSVDGRHTDEPRGRLSFPGDEMSARRDPRDGFGCLQKLDEGESNELESLGMIHLKTLVCGHAGTRGVAKTALDQLARTIDGFGRRAFEYLRTPATDDSLTFGPFCARVILENGCAALVGRLDCFRILYLSEFQSNPDYAMGKRMKSAFGWTGDVIPDEKPPAALWNPDHDALKISRALLSAHLDHLYWKPAVESVLDFVSARDPNAIFSELLNLDSETYIAACRGRAQQLYSILSKGVHWEFFTSALLFDEATVKAGIRDTFLLVGQLGLISHFIPTAYASLAPNEAVDAYVALRKDVP